MGARVWWLLSSSFTTEAIPDVYHRLDVKTHSTLCGMKMPESYGRFTGQHTSRMQVKLRCQTCDTLNVIQTRERKWKANAN